MSSQGSFVVWYHGATAPYRMKLSTLVGAAKDEEPRDGRDDPLPMRPRWWAMSKLKLSEFPEADRLSLVQYTTLKTRLASNPEILQTSPQDASDCYEG